MNNKDIKKYLKKLNNNKTKHSFIKRSISKLLICTILFLTVSILYKTNNNFHTFVIDNFYNKNFNFTKIKNIYNKYFGGIFPLEETKIKSEVVFNEKLKYTEKEKYYDGVKLIVNTNYLTPTLKSGLVIYIGEKENYGNTIIIEGEDGTDIWYGNISNPSVKLYDYIEKGNYLGETKDNILYLVFSRNGKKINYEEFLN